MNQNAMRTALRLNGETVVDLHSSCYAAFERSQILRYLTAPYKELDPIRETWATEHKHQNKGRLGFFSVRNTRAYRGLLDTLTWVFNL